MTEEDSWRNFPIIPFFNGNVKLGIFLGLPALTAMIIPNEIVFDALAGAAVIASIPLDRKFLKEDVGPNDKFFGKPITPKLVTQVSYATSCLLSYGVFGGNYLVSSVFTLACYLGFMGAYRMITQFLPPEKITVPQIMAAGTALGSIIPYIFTDLSDVATGAPDLTHFTLPIYVAGTYFIGSQVFKLFKDASKRIAIDPEAEQIDKHTTKFLVVYKWINITAYLIYLSLIWIAESMKEKGPGNGKKES